MFCRLSELCSVMLLKRQFADCRFFLFKMLYGLYERVLTNVFLLNILMVFGCLRAIGTNITTWPVIDSIE